MSNYFKKCLVGCILMTSPAVFLQSCKPAMEESVDSEEQSVFDLLKRLATIQKLSDFDPKWLTGNPVSKATTDFVNKILELAKSNRAEFLKFRSFVLKNPAKAGAAKNALNLVVGSEKDWLDFVDSIAEKGVSDQALATTLVPVLQNLDESTKVAIWAKLKKLYPQAYHNKHRSPVGNGFAPKRAFDLILRFTMAPEPFFKSGIQGKEALQSLNKYIKFQHDAAFAGTKFGQYTGDDIYSIAKHLQKFLIKNGVQGEEILFKGSMPSGRANLAKRNPMENIVDSAIQGFNTSYSDIDVLVPEHLLSSIKTLEANAYSALVSPEGKGIVAKTGAKASIQPHVWPDLFAEVDGSFMSPVGIRITKERIYVNIYRSTSRTELPEKGTVDKMNSADKEAFRKQWIRSIPLD